MAMCFFLPSSARNGHHVELRELIVTPISSANRCQNSAIYGIGVLYNCKCHVFGPGESHDHKENIEDMVVSVIVDKHHLFFPVDLRLIARVGLEVHLGGLDVAVVASHRLCHLGEAGPDVVFLICAFHDVGNPFEYIIPIHLLILLSFESRINRV